MLRHLLDNWQRAYKSNDTALCAKLERVFYLKVLDAKVSSYTIALEKFSPYHKLRFQAPSHIDSIRRVNKADVFN